MFVCCCISLIKSTRRFGSFSIRIARGLKRLQENHQIQHITRCDPQTMPYTTISIRERERERQNQSIKPSAAWGTKTTEKLLVLTEFAAVLQSLSLFYTIRCFYELINVWRSRVCTFLSILHSFVGFFVFLTPPSNALVHNFSPVLRQSKLNTNTHTHTFVDMNGL